MWLPTRNLNILFIAAISPLFETFLCILKNSIKKIFFGRVENFSTLLRFRVIPWKFDGFLAQISKEVNFIIFEVLKSVHLVSRKHAIFCCIVLYSFLYFQQKILPASCITVNKITKNITIYGSCTILPREFF